MIARIAFICAATLVIPASTASAQGRPTPQVVLSEAVLKSMTANKPKSKTPLTARLRMVRQSSVVAATPLMATPTSVREATPVSKKRSLSPAK